MSASPSPWLAPAHVRLVPVALAMAIGLDEAMFIQQLHYWIERTGHEHEGQRWVYNSLEAWQRQLPWHCLRTVKGIVGRLRKRGLVLTANLNKSSWDRTLWYAIDYAALDRLEAQAPPDDRLDDPERALSIVQDATDHDAAIAPCTLGTDCTMDHAPFAQYVKITTKTTQENNTREGAGPDGPPRAPIVPDGDAGEGRPGPEPVALPTRRRKAATALAEQGRDGERAKGWVELHPLFEPVRRAIGYGPRSRPEWATWGMAISTLAKAGVTPEEVPRLARAWPSVMGVDRQGQVIRLTVMGLANNVGRLSGAPVGGRHERGVLQHGQPIDHGRFGGKVINP